MYLGACCLFKIFEQGRFAVGTCVSKIIEYASPAVFSVYLIHDNIFIKQIIWTFVKLNIGDNVVSFMATFLPTIVIIFVLGVCTDLLMNKLLTTIKRRKI